MISCSAPKHTVCRPRIVKKCRLLVFSESLQKYLLFLSALCLGVPKYLHICCSRCFVLRRSGTHMNQPHFCFPYCNDLFLTIPTYRLPMDYLFSFRILYKTSRQHNFKRKAEQDSLMLEKGKALYFEIYFVNFLKVHLFRNKSFDSSTA